MAGRYGERLRGASQRESSGVLSEKPSHDTVELHRLLIVRQHPRRVEDTEMNGGIERKEAAGILDRSLDRLFSPDEKYRLPQPAHRAPDVEVEVPGQKRRGSVSGARLMRRAMVDV